MAIHKTKRTFVLIFFFLFISLSLISCNKKKEEVIEFNETHPLSLAPDVEWALITDPYAAYRKDIEWNAQLTNGAYYSSYSGYGGFSELRFTYANSITGLLSNIAIAGSCNTTNITSKSLEKRKSVVSTSIV